MFSLWGIDALMQHSLRLESVAAAGFAHEHFPQ